MELSSVITNENVFSAHQTTKTLPSKNWFHKKLSQQKINASWKGSVV